MFFARTENHRKHLKPPVQEKVLTPLRLTWVVERSNETVWTFFNKSVVSQIYLNTQRFSLICLVDMNSNKD